MKQGIHAVAGATAIAIAISCAGPAQAQTTSASPFQIVEASIDDIHTAFRSGRLTARQVVQSYLDRIDAYDKQGPNINSVITINPNALAEADRLDAAIAQSRKQLTKLRARLGVLPEESQAEIAPLLDAYLQMIGPSRLVRGARRRVAEALVNAEAAVSLPESLRRALPNLSAWSSIRV